MSFNTGLSGLRAATSDLNVTGNNIANASTTHSATSPTVSVNGKILMKNGKATPSVP